MSLNDAIALVNNLLRRNDDPHDTMLSSTTEQRSQFARVLAEASRSLERAPAGKTTMKPEDYGALAFVFACLVLTAVARWCDREHERIFHNPQKGGALNFELRQTQVK